MFEPNIRQVQNQQNFDSQSVKIETLFEIPDCSICLMKLSNQIYALACGHVFHQNCIKVNFLHRRQCPICKIKASFNLPITQSGVKLFFTLNQKSPVIYDKKMHEERKKLWHDLYSLQQDYQQQKRDHQKLKSKYQVKCYQAKKCQELQQRLKLSANEIQLLLKNNASYYQNLKKVNHEMNRLRKVVQQKQDENKFLLEESLKSQNQNDSLKEKMNKITQSNLEFVKQLEALLQTHFLENKRNNSDDRDGNQQNSINKDSSQNYRKQIISKFTQFFKTNNQNLSTLQDEIDHLKHQNLNKSQQIQQLNQQNQGLFTKLNRKFTELEQNEYKLRQSNAMYEKERIKNENYKSQYLKLVQNISLFANQEIQNSQKTKENQKNKKMLQ